MRKFEETSVSFVEDLLPEVPSPRGLHQGNYYRGHANGAAEIKPSLFRAELENTECRDWLELANSRMLKFKQLAPAEIRSQLSSELEWTATASHHGVPTQFTSWTDAALVGLYFATEETPDQADGALWRLLPGHDAMTISQDYEQVPDAPRFYHPQNQNDEMTAQRVCFLTHPFPDADSPPVSFENYYNASDEPCNLCKITIPHGAKRGLRRQIAALGFDSRTIYPGLKGIGRLLSEDIYSQTKSFDWIM